MHIYLSRSIHSIDLNGLWRTVKLPPQGRYFHASYFSHGSSCFWCYYSAVSTQIQRQRSHSSKKRLFSFPQSQGRSFWRVEPSEGEVPPESQLELQVVAHLKDTIGFQDRLEVSIQESQTHMVPLSATGTGTTIVSDRPFTPSLDLGTHFR